MTRKINISEEERKDIRKQYNILNERLGIPDNIIETGTLIFKQILLKLGVLIKNGYSIDTLKYRPITFKGDYHISDFNFQNVEVQFNLNEDEEHEPQIYSMAFISSYELNNKFQISKIELGNPVKLSISVVIKPNDNISTVEHILLRDSKVVLSSLIHELKHSYDAYKKPTISSIESSKYESYTNNSFGRLTPINDYLHKLYYINTIENLVRPSEMYARMDNEGITKSKFLEFLKKDKIFENLDEIRNLTLDKLKNDLLVYIDEIKNIFDNLDIEYSNLNDNQIIDEVLRLFVLNIKGWAVEALKDNLSTSFTDDIFGFTGNKQIYYKNFVHKMGKESKNTAKFFDKQEKVFKFVSNKMIKKLSKLYDMAKDDETEQNESILNPDFWYNHVAKKDNIVTEFNNTTNKNKIKTKNMGILKITEEEKAAIHKSHQEAETRNRERLEELKKGLQKPSDKKPSK